MVGGGGVVFVSVGLTAVFGRGGAALVYPMVCRSVDVFVYSALTVVVDVLYSLELLVCCVGVGFGFGLMDFSHHSHPRNHTTTFSESLPVP